MDEWVLEVSPGITLSLMDLPCKRRGYHHFLGIWLLEDQIRKRTVLVDTGPASTVPTLLEELEKRGVKHLDYILISHIHLDHSGGLAEVLEAFPEAKVAVHPKGKPHLINPQKLWEGSLEVLGEIALEYKEPKPVQEEAFLPEPMPLEGITALDTPGHAPHHRSFFYDTPSGKILFVGEAGGTYGRRGFAYPGKDDGTFILRPATPPRFYINKALESIANLKKIPSKIMCYAHFGYTYETERMLNEAAEQLLRWQRLCLEFIKNNQITSKAEVDKEKLMEYLIEKDPLLEDFHSLPQDLKDREKDFSFSSLEGFLGAIMDK